MPEIICKRCGASNFKKNGIVRGHQRYHCHDCGCDFTMTPQLSALLEGLDWTRVRAIRVAAPKDVL